MAADLFKLFQTYWKAGTDARFNVECHAGKVWMNLEVRLSHPPPPLYPHHSQHRPPPPHRQPSRQSPSRLRRRAKRAKARAAATAAVSGAAEDAAVEDDCMNGNKTDAPAASFAPATAQLNLNHTADVQQHPQVAEEAVMPLNMGHVIHVPDLFCPDPVYHDLPAAAREVSQPPRQDTLPQLDGHADADVGAGRHETELVKENEDEDWINPDPVTGSWICRCCYYAHSFGTEDDLRKHHDTLSIEYQECNICYPWHVWI